MHVMNDPIHGLMALDGHRSEESNWFARIMDHPLFQRLRHIKQLGMADLIFPGAVHTRFNHSVGVSYLARRIGQHLASLGISVDPSVQLAALLHDVGHGPFSHAFEELMISVKHERVSHEDWGPFFLKAIVGESGFVLPPLQPLEASIVSSGLDCDRMDYLLRDSHFCGVAYGQYDLNWLIHCLTAVDHGTHCTLGVTTKGLAALSGFLNARRLMTKNVYQHPKIRRLQAMMVAFLEECITHLEALPKALQADPLGQFLLLLREFRQGRLDKSAFMQDAFPVYQHLTDTHVYYWLWSIHREEPRMPETIQDLAVRLLERRLPNIHAVPIEQVNALGAKVASWREQQHLPSWAIGVDALTTAHHPTPIWIQDSNAVQIQLASEMDTVIAAVEREVAHTAYLFADTAHQGFVDSLIASK